MVEMLQNIVNYADASQGKRLNDEVGNPGIFFLGKKRGKYILTAGNYMVADKVETLKGKLKFVNKMNKKQLIDFYNNIAEYFRKENIQKPDLSIIEMRLKSENKLIFAFDDVGVGHSFFTLQTVIAL
jgi:hypothetical protein